MWYLIEQKTPPVPSPKYWLGGTSGNGRTIGRKHVDIRLKASSVSRTHAKITILKAAFYTPVGQARQKTCVSVQDSSAYGTFLKYPPGHSCNRAGEIIGHHRRLDKDLPTDVCEGALLAFGAPSAWWKVAWQSFLIASLNLSKSQTDRLLAISKATSLQLADEFSSQVTHVVTEVAHPWCMKLLVALARDVHIVTCAWVESVNLVVTDGCKAITEASSDDTAVAASLLPDEKLFAPTFRKEDRVMFGEGVLDAVFTAATRARRCGLFKKVAFAFVREENRAKWTEVVEALGGVALLARSVAGKADGRRVVFIREDARRGDGGGERDRFLSETNLVKAVLGADLSALQGGETGGDVADVATPGPLDAESDAESDESDKWDERRKEDAGGGEEGDAVMEEVREVREKRGEKDGPRKRVRGVDGDADVGGDVGGGVGADYDKDMDNINEREFFKVSRSGERDTKEDVRAFRRRNVRTMRMIGLSRYEAAKEDGANEEE